MLNLVEASRNSLMTVTDVTDPTDPGPSAIMTCPPDDSLLTVMVARHGGDAALLLAADFRGGGLQHQSRAYVSDDDRIGGRGIVNTYT